MAFQYVSNVCPMRIQPVSNVCPMHAHVWELVSHFSNCTKLSNNCPMLFQCASNADPTCVQCTSNRVGTYTHVSNTHIRTRGHISRTHGRVRDVQRRTGGEHRFSVTFMLCLEAFIYASKHSIKVIRSQGDSLPRSSTV